MCTCLCELFPVEAQQINDLVRERFDSTLYQELGWFYFFVRTTLKINMIWSKAVVLLGLSLVFTGVELNCQLVYC